MPPRRTITAALLLGVLLIALYQVLALATAGDATRAAATAGDAAEHRTTDVAPTGTSLARAARSWHMSTVPDVLTCADPYPAVSAALTYRLSPSPADHPHLTRPSLVPGRPAAVCDVHD